MANNLHMGGRQLQIERAKLRDEAAVLRELKETYTRAGKDIAEKIRIQNGRINVLLKDIDNLDDKTRSILQAQIYQRDFQMGLKRQIDAFMDALNNSNSKTMNEYLANCYKNGFIGSVFDMQGQGVPLAMPIDPKKLAQASVLTPKLSRKLYGQYAGDVKQAARNEISRGIATASAYAEIARNIDAQVQVGYNKAARIARTEGHRIQAESAFDAQLAARDAGADVVKQWDSALDGRTRETHMKLDGQIRELDEPFEVDGMTAMYPSDFGDPAEDINCRCALTQRARWALDDDETKQLQNVEDMSDERKQMLADKLGITPAELEKYSGQTIPIKASNYADFRKKYNKIWNYEPVQRSRQPNRSSVAIKMQKQLQNFDITEGGQFLKWTTKSRIDYANQVASDYARQGIKQTERTLLHDKVRGYIQSSAYSMINNYWRSGSYLPRRCKGTVELLERLTKRNKLQRGHVGMRRVTLDYLSDPMLCGIDLTGLTIQVLRKNGMGGLRPVDIPKSKAAAQMICDRINEKIANGGIAIPDKAVTSISMSEGINYFTHYPVKIQLQMPKGTKGIFTQNYAESEYIASNNSIIDFIGAKVYNDQGNSCILIYAKLRQ